MIIYRTNEALKKDLFLHLEKCDDQFVPALSSRVDIKKYTQKLFLNAVTFEAWNNNKLIGVISVYLNDEKSRIGFISNVSVISDFEKQGIASRLLNMAKEYAIENEFYKLTLEAHPENKKAISFYQKHRFEKVSNSVDSIIMKCSIN